MNPLNHQKRVRWSTILSVTGFILAAMLAGCGDDLEEDFDQNGNFKELGIFGFSYTDNPVTMNWETTGQGDVDFRIVGCTGANGFAENCILLYEINCIDRGTCVISPNNGASLRSDFLSERRRFSLEVTNSFTLPYDYMKIRSRNASGREGNWVRADVPNPNNNLNNNNRIN